MLTIVDYGIGNLNSILNLLHRVGTTAVVTTKPEEIRSASKIILPGVGHFGKAMDNLRASGLVPYLEEHALEKKKPILGLCVGMQMLAQHGEEGDTAGLGWLKSKVIRFRFDTADKTLRVPHVGFNTVKFKAHPLLKFVPSDCRFYFTHSYHMVCDNPENEIGKTDYGYDFASIVGTGNIWGTQFHPEKSHHFGIKLLKGFVEV